MDPGGGRRRSSLSAATAVWPDHFVDAVATRLGLDAASADGRLASAPALAAFFQVCSTWRSVSHSELLWQELTCRIWLRSRSLPLPAGTTWRDEFIRLHRTGRNFRTCRYTHYRVILPSPDIWCCCCLALSEHHLAAGFGNGSVALFRLLDAAPPVSIVTYEPNPQRNRLGPNSRSISGLVLLHNRLIFSSLDGDVYVVRIEPTVSDAAQRAYEGNPVEDGTLVNFAADSRTWVGLYAGVPSRSWRVWDGGTEQVLYVGGSLTDYDTIRGWHLLSADLNSSTGVGRVRMPGKYCVAVGSTNTKIQSLDLDNTGQIICDLELPQQAVVNAVDAIEGRVMVVDTSGVVRMYQARTLEEICRFSVVTGAGGHVDDEVAAGSLNWGYAVLSSPGTMGVWDCSTGEYLYRFRERLRVANVMAASERHVAAWCVETGFHLWDFGSL